VTLFIRNLLRVKVTYLLLIRRPSKIFNPLRNVLFLLRMSSTCQSVTAPELEMRHDMSACFFSFYACSIQRTVFYIILMLMCSINAQNEWFLPILHRNFNLNLCLSLPISIYYKSQSTLRVVTYNIWTQIKDRFVNWYWLNQR
jgi:hypothetical protein